MAALRAKVASDFDGGQTILVKDGREGVRLVIVLVPGFRRSVVVVFIVVVFVSGWNSVQHGGMHR